LNKKLVKITVAFLAFMLFVGIVYAASYVMTSPSVTVTVSPQYTLVLTANPQTFTVDGSTTLTATCSDSSFNGNVDFYYGTTLITTVSASAGVASYSWTPSSPGTYSVYAQATHP